MYSLPAYFGTITPLKPDNRHSPSFHSSSGGCRRVGRQGSGTWHIRLPIVNVALFETSEGLILVNTGMTAAGPVIRELIEDLSDKSLKVIIYTHYHVDHAYGTWALTEGWDEPIRIIAHETTSRNFDRYRRFTGTIARLMSQNENQIIEAVENPVYPTETFSDTMMLTLGGEDFVLRHAPGETEDQLYVWAPERKILATALNDMAALEPEIILPGHGPAMTDPKSNIEELTTQPIGSSWISTESELPTRRKVHKKCSPTWTI